MKQTNKSVLTPKFDPQSTFNPGYLSSLIVRLPLLPIFLFDPISWLRNLSLMTSKRSKKPTHTLFLQPSPPSKHTGTRLSPNSREVSSANRSPNPSSTSVESWRWLHLSQLPSRNLSTKPSRRSTASSSLPSMTPLSSGSSPKTSKPENPNTQYSIFLLVAQI